MRWQSISSSRSSGTSAVCSQASAPVPRPRLTGGLAARLSAALRNLPDFDLAPIAFSCYGLEFIVTTIVAALLILVKRTLPALLAETPRAGRARRAGRQRLEPLSLLIAFFQRDADQFQPGAGDHQHDAACQVVRQPDQQCTQQHEECAEAAAQRFVSDHQRDSSCLVREPRPLLCNRGLGPPLG